MLKSIKISKYILFTHKIDEIEWDLYVLCTKQIEIIKY